MNASDRYTSINALPRLLAGIVLVAVSVGLGALHTFDLPGPRPWVGLLLVGFMLTFLGGLLFAGSGVLAAFGASDRALPTALWLELWGWRSMATAMVCGVLSLWLGWGTYVQWAHEEHIISVTAHAVPIATRTLEPGELLTEDGVRFQAMPGRYLRDSLRADLPKLGQRVTARIFAGEPIAPERVQPAHEPVPWDTLDPAHRWVPMAVPDALAARTSTVDLVDDARSCAVLTSLSARYAARTVLVAVPVAHAASASSLSLHPTGEVTPCSR